MIYKYQVRLMGVTNSWTPVPLADSYTVDGNGVLSFTRADSEKPRPISQLVASYAPGFWAAVAMTDIVAAGAALENETAVKG